MEVLNIDNIELLSQIKSDSINLIYCDILFGTGKDFIEFKNLKPQKEIFLTQIIMNKKTLSSLKNKFSKVEELNSKSTLLSSAFWNELIPYIKDYNEIDYSEWSCIDTTDGLCVSDNEGLNASVQYLLDIIESKGYLEEWDFYTCAI